MTRGAVTISIDLELAWGNWDNLTPGQADNVEHKERPIVARLVELFDRYELAATWAFVAALLDRHSASGRPGGERLWYGPDVIDRIRSAKVRHDLGSHGGRHIYLDSVGDEEARADLAFARSVYDREGIDVRSFVFPRNQIGRKDLLKSLGARVYRGSDWSWHQRIRNRHRLLGRAANLADKMLPVSPETVRPVPDGDLVNLPGSMLFLGREGVRSLAPPGAMQAKLAKGVEAAAKTGGVFHLWFHPSNFWHDTDRQFATFEGFARDVAERAGRGEIEVKPMAAFA
jgi:peptidoglycan/xylan/chitin deacetylase (PgdA/CDA1 family)